MTPDPAEAGNMRTLGEQAELALWDHGEIGAAGNLPATCPYTLEEILRRGRHPDPLGDKP